MFFLFTLLLVVFDGCSFLFCFPSLIVVVLFRIFYVLYLSSARCRVGHPNVPYKLFFLTQQTRSCSIVFVGCDAERTHATTCLLMTNIVSQGVIRTQSMPLSRSLSFSISTRSSVAPVPRRETTRRCCTRFLKSWRAHVSGDRHSDGGVDSSVK